MHAEDMNAYPGELMTTPSKKKKKGRRDAEQRPPIALSLKKKAAFAFLAFVLSCVFIVFLEGTLRLAGYGDDTRLFVTAEAEVDHFFTCNGEIGRQYFPDLAVVPKPSWDAFLKQKPPHGIRIFVLGGSTAAGFPYGNNLMFSRILNVKLQDAFPEKRIEIINTAMSATNTYTQLDFMDEIIAQKPDAILIYSGHNEYYGALGIASLRSLGRSPSVARAYLKLHRLKLFALARDAIGSLRSTEKPGQMEGSDFDPSATLMERMVGEQTIVYGGRLYQQGKKQLAGNLDRIYQKAQDAGIPIVISELVSNVRNQRPFASVVADDLPGAARLFQQAQALDKQGDHEQAKRLYVKAKDMDALRFRAPEEFNDIIRKIAQKYQRPVVPMKSYFEAASPQGIIGDNLMVDHLHPNIDGYFMMAEAFFNTLKEADMMDLHWDGARIKPMGYYQQHWGMTDLDLLCANLRIRYLKGGWPFRSKSMSNDSLRSFHPQTETESLALRVLTDDKVSIITGHYELAQMYEKDGDHRSAYEEYCALYHTIPWTTMFFNGAAENLLRLKRYDEVPPLLIRSLGIKETFFAQKWLGHLLVNQRHFTEAISYLEKAREGHEDNVQVLMCLEKAYQHTDRQDEALAIRQRLEILSPKSESLATPPP